LAARLTRHQKNSVIVYFTIGLAKLIEKLIITEEPDIPRLLSYIEEIISLGKDLAERLCHD
jgi:hypothetical protein